MRNAQAQHATSGPGSKYKDLIVALTLMLCAIVTGATREHRAQCSVEAKVSIERIGPHGTFAGHRP
jgi:hypothetical protein